jgi:protein phosphatase
MVNEDSYLIDKDLGLYIIADGVGGLEKGEIASHMACECILGGIKSGLTLQDSIYLAHRTIIGEIKSDKSRQGMATTVAAILFNNDSYEIVWIGDSRVYLWDKTLKLITKDDSYVELLLENGHITVDELASHPERNVISQALGIEHKNITINANSGTLKKGQVLLLCTDGLYTVSTEEHIIHSLNNSSNIEQITNELVDIAIDNQGKDNISLITINSNNGDVSEGQYPKIYREFDSQTGQILQKDGQINSSINIMQPPSEAQTDPELFDQTLYKEIGRKEREMLEHAAVKGMQTRDKVSKILFPLSLVLILLVVSYFIMGLL